jgi:viroplasmin and RNaseH domain-containing protein
MGRNSVFVKPQKNYYAVKRGRETGIFTTWGGVS